MTDYAIPGFFPDDLQAFIRELFEMEHCSKNSLIEMTDLRTLLNPELRKSWKTLKDHSRNDEAFEELFRIAYVHRADFKDSTEDLDADIGLCEEIAMLANSLRSLLTKKTAYIAQELDGSTYYLLKEANLPHLVQHKQQRQSAATTLRFLLKRFGNIIMRGFPRFSRLLEQLEHLALSQAEKLKEEKSRDKPKKLAQSTAMRTYGLLKMAECISQGGIVNHSWLEPLVDILDSLYPAMGQLDIDNAKKLCKNHLRNLSGKIMV